jgi:hypothetical protein
MSGPAVESWPALNFAAMAAELKYAITEARRVGRRPDRVLIREWEWCVFVGEISLNTEPSGGSVPFQPDGFAFFGVPIVPYFAAAAGPEWFVLARDL